MQTLWHCTNGELRQGSQGRVTRRPARIRHIPGVPAISNRYRPTTPTCQALTKSTKGVEGIAGKSSICPTRSRRSHCEAVRDAGRGLDDDDLFLATSLISICGRSKERKGEGGETWRRSGARSPLVGPHSPSGFRRLRNISARRSFTSSPSTPMCSSAGSTLGCAIRSTGLA